MVLVHQSFGVADLEVKGHRVTIRDGMWRDDVRVLDPQPFDQASGNAYALRDVLRRADPSLARLQVEYAVAFPNTLSVEGTLPVDLDRVQVLTAAELDDVAASIEELMFSRPRNRALDARQVEAIVAALRPDAELRWDPHSRMQRARTRLEELCADQTRTLERLDANRRVVAQGSAGTGKTALAVAWTRRAYARGERVLLTCYNDPLAEVIGDRLPDDEAVMSGAFLRLALGLEGMPPLVVPPDADHEWWTITAVGHIVTHWHQVTERFDTVVVDEAQDFSPAWLALLESLLDPDGPRRMLMVADAAQELYLRGFSPPEADDGWTRCELVNNCRNAQGIARLLRRHLDGAPSPVVGPEAVDVRWTAAEDGDAAVAGARAEWDRLRAEGRDPHGIAVLTFSTAMRTRVAEALALPRWEHRDRGGLCENVHRVKGLEFDTVVLVADTADVAQDLLYVGVGRAVSELVLVGPQRLASRLRLAEMP